MSIGGPNFPATVVDDSTVGTVAWSSVTRVEATDSSYATAATTGSGVISHYINCQNFGFNVPSNATIAGVLCKVIFHCATSSQAEDYSVKLIKGGTISGTNEVSTPAITLTSDETFVYGGPTTLWGLSLAPSDVNASNFGVAWACEGVSGGATSSVDSITLQVYYYISETSVTFPGTAADVAPGGDTAWSNVNNIKTTDGSYATASIPNSSSSDYLEATNFGFSIPSNATINGILVCVTANGGNDLIVQLIKGGTISGNNYAITWIDSAAWNLGAPPSSTGPTYYGGATDLWGLTLAPSDVNSSNFGVVYQNKNNGSKTGTTSVDSISVVVSYTTAASAGSTSPVAVYGSGLNVPLAVYRSGLAQPISIKC